VEENLISDKMSKTSIVEIDPVNNERREKIKEAMLHAWNSYVTYAWGMDELQVRVSHPGLLFVLPFETCRSEIPSVFFFA
jgi:hypothetical protein